MQGKAVKSVNNTLNNTHASINYITNMKCDASA